MHPGLDHGALMVEDQHPHGVSHVVQAPRVPLGQKPAFHRCVVGTAHWSPPSWVLSDPVLDDVVREVGHVCPANHGHNTLHPLPLERLENGHLRWTNVQGAGLRRRLGDAVLFGPLPAIGWIDLEILLLDQVLRAELGGQLAGDAVHPDHLVDVVLGAERTVAGGENLQFFARADFAGDGARIGADLNGLDAFRSGELAGRGVS